MLTNAQIEAKFIIQDQRFDRIEKTMETQFQQLRHEMQIGFDKLFGFMIDMKQEMSLMNHAISRVEADVAVLKVDVAGLRRDISTLQQDVSLLQHDMTKVKGVLKIE